MNAKSGATTKRRLKAVKESLLKGSSGPTNGSNGSNTTAPQSSDKNILSNISSSDSSGSHTIVSQSNDKNILGNNSTSDSKKRTRPTVSAVCFRVTLYLFYDCYNRLRRENFWLSLAYRIRYFEFVLVVF